LSLVDPDNRRPVNFAARAKRPGAPETPDWAPLVEKWRNGELKFAWTRHLLKLRAEHAELFTFGDYQPLEVSGPHREHIIAFARRRDRRRTFIEPRPREAKPRFAHERAVAQSSVEIGGLEPFIRERLAGLLSRVP
jgi:maltooligosyltrehalose synthase